MRKLKLFSILTAYWLCMALLAGCGTDMGSLPNSVSGPDALGVPPVSDPAQTSEETGTPSETGDSSVSAEESPSPDASSDPDAASSPKPSSPKESVPEESVPEESLPEESSPESAPSPSPEKTVGSRSNTPRCLTPSANGTAEVHNEVSSIDYSNASEGYIMAVYTGSSPKIKMQIIGPNAVTYTYNLTGSDYEAFPLSSGNGSYEITIYENISGTSYSMCLTTSIDVSLTSDFSPYLYPNQYCNFNSSSAVVAKAKELALPADTDLDVVTNVYNYIIENISYDYSKASTVPSGYIPNVDQVLASGTGICLDYAAVMTSMLRSQRIPTRLEVGYAGDAYHAWISTYISDVGWVNGIVEFDGQSWELMDPTFAASNSEETLREFIGEGTNYLVKYMY